MSSLGFYKKNFDIEFTFKNHRRACKRRHEEGGPKTYECNLCFKTYLTQPGLNSHKTVFHEGLKKYACTQCDKTYTDSTPLRKHILSVHTEDSGPFNCSKCDKVFDKAVKRDAHFYYNHVVSKEKIPCRFCSKAYHKYSIKEHEQAHIDFEQEKFKCEKCLKVFRRIFELKKHMNQKHVDLDNSIIRHECNECGKTFKAKEYLRKHIRAHNLDISCLMAT